MGNLIEESQNSITKAKIFKDSVEKFQQRHLSNSIMVVVGVYILFSVVNYAFKQRKIFLSLGSAFALLGMIIFCCILNGRPA